MSTVRRLTVSVIVAGALAVLGATVAFAQAGPTNPSGGTGCRQSKFEGTGSITQPAQVPSPTAWSSWFGGISLSRYGFSATWAGVGRPLQAIVRRSPARR